MRMSYDSPGISRARAADVLPLPVEFGIINAAGLAYCGKAALLTVNSVDDASMKLLKKQKQLKHPPYPNLPDPPRPDPILPCTAVAYRTNN